jgi:hypothetical protein
MTISVGGSTPVAGQLYLLGFMAGDTWHSVELRRLVVATSIASFAIQPNIA